MVRTLYTFSTRENIHLTTVRIYFYQTKKKRSYDDSKYDTTVRILSALSTQENMYPTTVRTYFTRRKRNALMIQNTIGSLDTGNICFWCDLFNTQGYCFLRERTLHSLKQSKPFVGGMLNSAWTVDVMQAAARPFQHGSCVSLKMLNFEPRRSLWILRLECFFLMCRQEICT